MLGKSKKGTAFMNFGYNAYGKSDATLSVSEANKYVKMLMENDALLSSIAIRGEISNLKYHTSGHLYFTLKDEEAEISAVMFRSAASQMRFTARDGMKVTAFGRISVYEKSGKCQIYVSAMTDDGKGTLQIEYERLLRKLTEEGLFDQKKKKKLPKIPSCIGIITSPTGAAIRDMINVTGRRWPFAKILLYPSLVQGAEAPQSLCDGLGCLNALNECDVIIIGRGGGSIEDLWAFNDERVVRAVAASEIPVISAVGHETDFTLCDFAADHRAPTPSAAAEIAVPDRAEYRLRSDDALSRLESLMERCVSDKKRCVTELGARLEYFSPMSRLKNERKTLEHNSQLLEISMHEILRRHSDKLSMLAGRLDAMSPLAVLGRGYSVMRLQNGEVVSSVKHIEKDDTVNIILSDGTADAKIISVDS